MAHDDVTGKRFGNLIAIQRDESIHSKETRWRFQCDCGKEAIALLNNVKRGLTKSCGCLRKGSEIANKRFGRLVAGIYKDGFWTCQCDCGNTTRVRSTSLRKGTTRSCGCLRTEEIKARCTIHGMRKTPEFRVWSGMRNRCENPNNRSFFLYGARGIKVCERWNVFTNFYEDMGPRPSPTHSIERLNNSLDYCPSNCIWATPQEQANNRRSSRLYEFNGQLMTIRQAIVVSNSTVKISTVRARVANGMSLEKAIHN